MCTGQVDHELYSNAECGSGTLFAHADGKQNAEKMFENCVSKCENEQALPVDHARDMANKEKLQERWCRVFGRNQRCQLLLRSTQEKMVDPAKRADYFAKTEKLPKDARTKKIRGAAQIARLNVALQAYSSRVVDRGAPVEAGKEGHQGIQTALPNMYDGQAVCTTRQEGSRLL